MKILMDGWMLAGLVGTALWTNLVMVVLKNRMPDWNKKAWAPPVIGLMTTVLGALVADQCNSWNELGMWVLTGLGAGSAASSGRDILVGK